MQRSRQIIMKLLLVTISVVFLQLAAAIPIQDDFQSSAVSQGELEYLARYGYLSEHETKSQVAVTDAIKAFQKFVALPVTGVIDEPTKKIMQSPRCGFPDVISNEPRWELFPSGGWKKKNVTYYIQNVSSLIDFEESARYMKMALDRWAYAGNLTFTRIYDDNADIISYFGNKSHGDYWPFDGKGGILAHAYAPGSDIGGDIHFDGEEEWAFLSSANGQGTDFYTVAVHELGHSMGLRHSDVQTAIMFPYYQYISTERSLDYDDIMGMYELYLKYPIQ